MRHRFAMLRIDACRLEQKMADDYFDPEPLLEPMADVVFAAGEMQKMVQRLGPVHQAFERMQRLHGRESGLKRVISAQSERIAELEQALKEVKAHAANERDDLPMTCLGLIEKIANEALALPVPPSA